MMERVSPFDIHRFASTNFFATGPHAMQERTLASCAMGVGSCDTTYARCCISWKYSASGARLFMPSSPSCSFFFSIFTVRLP